jgi:hypothetical protein
MGAKDFRTCQVLLTQSNDLQTWMTVTFFLVLNRENENGMHLFYKLSLSVPNGLFNGIVLQVLLNYELLFPTMFIFCTLVIVSSRMNPDIFAWQFFRSRFKRSDTIGMRGGGLVIKENRHQGWRYPLAKSPMAICITYLTNTVMVWLKVFQWEMY